MTTKLLTVLLTVISTVGFATDNESKENYLKVVPKIGGDSYKIIYQGKTAEPVFVSIKDESGRVIAKERYRKTEGFILPVNLENISSGTYKIEIKSKSNFTSGEINHQSRADYLKSRLFLQTKNGMFGLVGYELGVNDLYVLVTDDKNNIVYKDRFETNGVLNKQYKLDIKDSKWLSVAVYHGNDLLIKSRVIR